MPLMRQLSLAYPDDRIAAGREDEFLFGPDLLAAPVLEPGASDAPPLPARAAAGSTSGGRSPTTSATARCGCGAARLIARRTIAAGPGAAGQAAAASCAPGRSCRCSRPGSTPSAATAIPRPRPLPSAAAASRCSPSRAGPARRASTTTGGSARARVGVGLGAADRGRAGEELRAAGLDADAPQAVRALCRGDRRPAARGRSLVVRPGGRRADRDLQGARSPADSAAALLADGIWLPSRHGWHEPGWESLDRHPLAAAAGRGRGRARSGGRRGLTLHPRGRGLRRARPPGDGNPRRPAADHARPGAGRPSPSCSPPWSRAWPSTSITCPCSWDGTGSAAAPRAPTRTAW